MFCQYGTEETHLQMQSLVFMSLFSVHFEFTLITIAYSKIDIFNKRTHMFT